VEQNGSDFLLAGDTLRIFDNRFHTVLPVLLNVLLAN